MALSGVPAVHSQTWETDVRITIRLKRDTTGVKASSACKKLENILERRSAESGSDSGRELVERAAGSNCSASRSMRLQTLHNRSWVQRAGCGVLALLLVAAPSGGALPADDVNAATGGMRRDQPARLQIAGAVLVVVHDGSVVLSRGYGLADVATGRPMTGDTTLVRPGSI